MDAGTDLSRDLQMSEPLTLGDVLEACKTVPRFIETLNKPLVLRVNGVEQPCRVVHLENGTVILEAR